MDRVRFGRALGVGAREAAKALMKAADAAAAPNPTAAKTVHGDARPAGSAGARAAQQVERVRTTTAGVKRGGKKFGEAVWAPITKAGGVLWLEVTGVLFGMFAVAFGVWAWRVRADFMAAGAARERAWGALAMLLLFGYFTVSSYVKAARRQRR